MTRALAVVLLFASACSTAPSNGFAIDLTITQGSVARDQITKARTLELTAIGSENASRIFTLDKPFESGEERVIYRPRVLDGVLQFTAIVKLVNGMTIASGQAAVRINPFNTATATITLAPGLVVMGDLAAAPQDMAGVTQDLRRADLSEPRRSCNLLTQSPCTSLEKCTIDENSNGYCAADGTVPTGGQCSINVATHDNCVRTNACLTIQATGVLWCIQFCSIDSDCKQPAPNPGNRPLCVQALQGSTVKLCSIACNPIPSLGPSGCATGLKCTLGIDNNRVYTDCDGLGTGTDGAACPNGSRDCAAGHLCITSKCRAMCRIGQSDCTATFTCTAPPNTNAPLYGWCCPSTGC